MSNNTTHSRSFVQPSCTPQMIFLKCKWEWNTSGQTVSLVVCSVSLNGVSLYYTFFFYSWHNFTGRTLSDLMHWEEILYKITRVSSLWSKSTAESWRAFSALFIHPLRYNRSGRELLGRLLSLTGSFITQRSVMCVQLSACQSMFHCAVWQ